MMLREKFTYLISILLCLFLNLAGCSAISSCHEGSRSIIRQGNVCYESLDKQIDVLDLKCLFVELAKEICNGGSVSTCAEVAEKNAPLCMQEKSVLVTDFVDLNSLTPKPAGIVMGEVMRSALNSVCGYNIQQAELSKYFTLNEKGLGVLTRNNLLIRQDEVKKDFIVGTYSQSPDKLMIFVKKFDLTTGKITKMSSKEITFTCSDNKITYKVY